MPWYSDYPHFSPGDPVNALYKDQIDVLVLRFNLKKVASTTTYVSNTQHTPYTLPGTGWRVLVMVDQLEYGLFDHEYSFDEYQAQFRLKLRLARLTSPFEVIIPLLTRRLPRLLPILARHEKPRLFFKNKLLIQFPGSFPRKPPLYRVEDRRYESNMSSHTHHMWEGGWMCIMAGDNDWNQNRGDNVLSGMGPALDWIAWHFKEFGW